MGEIAEALRRARNAQRSRRAPSLVAEAQRGPGSDAALPQRAEERPSPVEIPSDDGDGDGAWTARAVLVDPQGATAEQYRHCAIRLSRELEKREGSLVAVTSAARGDGKTTTACNLAFALAGTESGHRVALVELDLRRPSHSAALRIRPRIGFESVLSGEAALADACLPTQLPDLDLLPVRNRPDDPVKLLANHRTADALAELRQSYDTVIVDMPPVLAVSDVPLVLPSLDAVLLVVTPGESRIGAVKAAIGTIGSDKIVGVFMNRSRQISRQYYGYGYSLDDDAGDSRDAD